MRTQVSPRASHPDQSGIKSTVRGGADRSEQTVPGLDGGSRRSIQAVPAASYFPLRAWNRSEHTSGNVNPASTPVAQTR